MGKGGNYEYIKDRNKIEDKIDNFFRKVRKKEIEDIKLHYGNIEITNIAYLYRNSRFYIHAKDYRGQEILKFETTGDNEVQSIAFDSIKHRYSHTLILKFKKGKNDLIITGVRKDNKYYDNDLNFLWE